MKYSLILLALALVFCACGVVKPSLSFEDLPPPPLPDYSNEQYWAALPFRYDSADRVPDPTLMKDQQADAPVDVFFLHPTTYVGKKGESGWNAPLDNSLLNERTDGSTILFQATVFNGAGKIYAPRYRQAHIMAYFTKKDTTSAKEALDLAYADVKKAFEYYLDNHNQGRPIIIASHSQGTSHAKRLMREFMDGKPLQNRLVAAYLVGIPVEVDYFHAIPACKEEGDTGCFVAWRTFKKGYRPKYTLREAPITVTNPLTWTLDGTPAPKSLNQGAVLLKFHKIWPQVTDAQVAHGILWSKKPKFPGSFLITKRNYHIGDYNLFYLNIRNNAILRAKNFLK